jgi:hypothetical protein
LLNGIFCEFLLKEFEKKARSREFIVNRSVIEPILSEYQLCELDSFKLASSSSSTRA